MRLGLKATMPLAEVRVRLRSTQQQTAANSGKQRQTCRQMWGRIVLPASRCTRFGLCCLQGRAVSEAAA